MPCDLTILWAKRPNSVAIHRHFTRCHRPRRLSCRAPGRRVEPGDGALASVANRFGGARALAVGEVSNRSPTARERDEGCQQKKP